MQCNGMACPTGRHPEVVPESLGGLEDRRPEQSGYVWNVRFELMKAIESRESDRRLIPLNEAARRCGVSRETFYRWIRQGRMPEPIKHSNRPKSRSYVMSSVIEDYLDKMERSVR